MFSKIIKGFFLKKIISSKLSSANLEVSVDKIQTVGVIVDESYFSDIDLLKKELEQYGVEEKNIQILLFKKKVSKKEIVKELFFTRSNVKFNGEIDKLEVNSFLEQSFDLLINYYEVERSSLLLVSKASKAKFKVGFSTIDKRVNHLMINTSVNQYKGFVSELFKYLKILNKL
ncbi:DUF6913 domain-containing protein [Flavobacterium sp.]|jgi:hypothetical protein|uniref:DUF6913 domain-containing protein n=1 Tax=Flavobacterium sp. TaxID=239 RepID=UPI002A806208|nr:hypothetical protein [Flavobacterium sp.]